MFDFEWVPNFDLRFDSKSKFWIGISKFWHPLFKPNIGFKITQILTSDFESIFWNQIFKPEFWLEIVNPDFKILTHTLFKPKFSLQILKPDFKTQIWLKILNPDFKPKFDSKSWIRISEFWHPFFKPRFRLQILNWNFESGFSNPSFESKFWKNPDFNFRVWTKILNPDFQTQNFESKFWITILNHNFESGFPNSNFDLKFSVLTVKIWVCKDSKFGLDFKFESKCLIWIPIPYLDFQAYRFYPKYGHVTIIKENMINKYFSNQLKFKILVV